MASLPGANPEVMASSVATPLERQFGHIAGVTEMTSNSGTGSASIVLQFDLSRNINAAAREVQAAISQARNYLPTNMPSNPTYRKMNASEAPIAIISVASKTYDQSDRYDAVSTILSQRLSQIPGVGQVEVGGGALPAVRIDVNPLQLEHYGISLAQVANFLRQQNAHTPTGSISNSQTVSYIAVNDQISKAADYRPLIIATRNGAAVRLSDVATVSDSQENLLSAGYMNGLPSVDMIIFKQAGANIVETIDRIKAEFPVLQASIPKGNEAQHVAGHVQHHPCFIARRRAHPPAIHCPGHPGCLCLLAQLARHHHSRYRRSRFPHRDLCRHVPAQLFTRQSFPHGADHLHGLCDRRCHRGHGKHRAHISNPADPRPKPSIWGPRRSGLRWFP